MTVKFGLLLMLSLFWSYTAVAKYKVCSITINSADEIEVFKQQLGTQDFEFIELVPLSIESRPNNIHWFTNACKQGHKCDILVISGHFGGLFFGEKNNYILPVDIMEKQSCSGSCAGLLSNVKEVFLFGCYTLANKRSRQRTPEQHLEVLLHYNYARDMAETVVAGIYLPFGLSFEHQMQLAFSGGSSIYGFTELSPLGKDIRWPLANYFGEVKRHYGSYKSWLDQKRPQVRNPLIYNTIGGAISEVKGIGPNNDQFPQFQKICNLYQEDLSKVKGIQEIQNLITAGDGPMAYLAIKNFISENRPFEGRSLTIFNEIRNNSNFKNEFYVLYSQISSRLPYVKIQFLNFLNFFSWVSNSFYKRELKANTLKIVSRPTSEAYDFATALVYDEQISVPDLNLTEEDFPSDFYRNIWSALILETLNVRNYIVHRRLMNACLAQVRKDPVICYQVLKSLGHLKVNDKLIIDKMVEFLTIPHYGLVYYALYGLAYSGVQDCSVHLAMAKHIHHSDNWVHLQAIRSLGLLKSQCSQVNAQMVNFVESVQDEELIYESLVSLYHMNPNVQSLRQIIIKRKFHEHSNQKIKDIAISF